MSDQKYVYLAGPITGTDSQSDWRAQAIAQLADDISVLSPTRDTFDTTPDVPLTFEKLLHGKGVLRGQTWY